MRKVPTRMLRAGMETARPIFDSRGFLLLNRGMILTRGYIKQLKKLNIQSLYVKDPLIPDVKIEDVILEETRQKAYFKVKDALSVLKRQPEQRHTGLLLAKKELSSVLDDIIAELLEKRELTVDLSDIRTFDDYTFSHSVNVAVLSVMTALSMGMSKHELKVLGMGALLHDMGKILVPQGILNKPGPLDEVEIKEIEKHPYNGHVIARENHLFSYRSLAVIHQHHERFDGSGYPQGLSAEEIDPLSGICAVCDVYDALTADRPYRLAYPSHKALEVMEAQKNGFFSEAAETLLGHIPAYPVGTVVGLDSNIAGVVVENTVGYPKEPKIRILFERDSVQKVSPYEVDVKEVPSVKIDYVYEEEELMFLYLEEE